MSDDVKTNYCGYFASHQKVTLDADGLEKLKKLNYSTYLPAIPMYLPFRYMLSTCLFIAKR